MSEVYLDNHSATRPLQASIDASSKFLRTHWGSTTSPHQKGQELFEPLHSYVETLLTSLGAHPSDRFYFFASHADAIEHLFFSYYLEQIRQSGKNHILTTAIEEAAILMSLKKLEELGCHGKMLPVDSQGRLTPEALNEAIKPRSALLSLAWASGLTGVMQPIEELSKICKEKQIALHVDASYVIGKWPISFHESGIDFMTFDGSFFHAPKGTAGLIIRDKTPLSAPLSAMTGMSVGGIAALSTAVDVVQQKMDRMQLETARLRDLLEKGILKGFPEAKILFKQPSRLPNCTTIAFPGVECDALLFLLNRKKVYASLGGGHCQKLSHLLIASHVDPALAQSALSFSLSYETTKEEIDQAVDAIVKAAHNLSKLSSHL
jgi:cysteine desulfurase